MLYVLVSFLNKLNSSHLFQRVASFLHLIDTIMVSIKRLGVLISFREWLHSYKNQCSRCRRTRLPSSHLFQRVASFLLGTSIILKFSTEEVVLISFREWLHSYESIVSGSPRRGSEVLISFREWLHSY